MPHQFGFHYVFQQGDPAAPVLLLLHGTGGDEHDLLDIGRAVAPEASLLSVRGNVLEHGLPRFFKRLSEGVFDLNDLAMRADELAAFLQSIAEHYHIEKQPLYALGFSNGANIASSLLFRHPHILTGAALIRGMLPYEPILSGDLNGKHMVLINGLMDPIVPIEQPRHLAELLQQKGAEVNMIMKPVGHNLVQSDLTDLQHWWQSRSFVKEIT